MKKRAQNSHEWISTALALVLLCTSNVAQATTVRLEDSKSYHHTLAPPSAFSASQRAKIFLNEFPKWAKVATSYLVVGSMAAVAYGFGIPAKDEYPILNIWANIGLYTCFNMMTDFLGQWIAGNRLLWRQVYAAFPSGFIQALVTWQGYLFINAWFPKDGMWPSLWVLGLVPQGMGVPVQDTVGYFLVANTRTLLSFLVVFARTRVYSTIVQMVRHKAAQTPEELRQAKLSRAKQDESYLMTRGPSYVKNWIVQMLVPKEYAVAVEGVVTQFFQIFYTWSVNKDGFIVRHLQPPVSEHKAYLIAYPVILPFVKAREWWQRRYLPTQLSPAEMSL
jgi:hypothetical protein